MIRQTNWDETISQFYFFITLLTSKYLQFYSRRQGGIALSIFQYIKYLIFKLNLKRNLRYNC